MIIRERKNRAGTVSYQLDCGKLNGRRVQLSFEKKSDAETEMAKRKGDLHAYGHSGFALTESERSRCMAVIARLSAVGATLEEAADYFLKHARPAAGPIGMLALSAAFREARREENCSVNYLRQLKCSTSALVRHVGELKPAHEVTATEIQTWLRSNRWEDKTWNIYLGDVSSMFSWAVEQGRVSVNPANAVKRKRVDRKEIRFLSVPQASALLQRAAKRPEGEARPGMRKIELDKEDHLDLLPMVVLGLFCGLRPDKELGQMRWEHLSLENKLVTVTSDRAKTRERRTIDLSPNAIVWLKWWLKQGGKMEAGKKIKPSNFESRWKRLRMQAGVFRDWPHDAVRHTFATMHYAHHRNEHLLQALMGHESAEMLHKHYRGLTTPTEGAKFWKLKPGA
jgi:integrase